jgi:hypothetical protein
VDKTVCRLRGKEPERNTDYSLSPSASNRDVKLGKVKRFAALSYNYENPADEYDRSSSSNNSDGGSGGTGSQSHTMFVELTLKQYSQNSIFSLVFLSSSKTLSRFPLDSRRISRVESNPVHLYMKERGDDRIRADNEKPRTEETHSKIETSSLANKEL